MATYYVSAVAANGIPAGNDQTGDGSKERPFASIEAANAAAKDGDTVMLNDGVYTPAKTLDISNAVSWQSVTDYGATIRAAAGQSRVVSISEEAAGTVSFGKIVIDGGNTSTSLITLNDQVSTYTLELNGTRLVNPTSYGIQGTSAGTHANVVLNDVDFSASSALSMVNISALKAGSVSIQGGTVNIASIWRAGFGGIANVNADAEGIPVTVSGVTANLNATGTDATYGKGIYYGVRLTDVKALIENNDITQSGTGSILTGYTISVTYDKTTNPIDISGGIIRNNTLKNFLDGTAGKIILVGWDSDPGEALRNYANDFQVYGNTGIGDDGAEAAKLHGILIGWQDGAQVYANSLDYTSLAYVLKGMSGETLVFDNTDTHTSSKSLYQKGGSGVQFLYNVSYQDNGFNPDAINIGDAGGGQYAAKDAVVIGNTVVYTGSPDSFLTVWDGSTAATISNNTYYSATGNSSSAWIYNGAAYSTIDGWKAAVEGDANYSGDVTLGQGAILGAYGLTGQRLELVGMVNGVLTYRITFINGVASDTNFAISNWGSAGAATISGLIDADMSGTGSSSLSGTATQDGSYAGLDSGESLVFSISYDGLSAVGGEVLHIYGNYTNTKPIDIVFQSIELPRPTIDGASTVSGTDAQVLSPFASMTITDADTSSASHTVRVKLNDAGTGSFTTLAGFVRNSDGTYSFTGTVAEVNAALQALRFTPTANQVAIGDTVTTHFTVTYSNDVYTVSSTAAQTVVTSVNDIPALAGLLSTQTVSDGTTIQPFAGVSFLDGDPGQTQTFRIALDKVTRGSFSNLGGFVDNGDGSYSFTGSAADLQTALQGLVFAPAPDQSEPGTATTAKLTITYSDGMAATQTSIAYLSILSENTAPSLAGSATSTINDKQAIKPFATMTVTDPDKGAIETVTVRIDDPAKGSFTSLGSFVDNGDGSYSYTGSPGAVQTALRALVFDPTDGRVPAGQTETVQFTVTVSDGLLTSTDTGTVVTVAATNTTPTLSGLPDSQTVSDNATIRPFAAASFADPDSGQVETITIALDKATRGTFSNLGGFVDNGDGSYSFTGSAADLQTALQGLVFTPAPDQSEPGTTTTAKLTVTYSDGVAATQTNIAYLSILSENTAPTLAGAGASSVTDVQTVKPFATMTIADPDKNASETVTVRLDDPAKGSFTTLAGFVDNGDGSYSFTGSPAAAQTALRGLVFNPTDWRVPGGATETVQFAVTVSDGAATTTDSNTTVTVTSTAPGNTAPTLSGLSTSQTVSERSSFQPFVSASYADPDASQTETIRIALDNPTLGSFTTLAGFVDGGNGVYTFTGTASAAQDALRGLVFTPAQHQVEPGQSATANLTVTYSDGYASPQTSTASLSITAEDTAPALAGATTGSSVTETQTVKPFAGMTITDPDKNATETVTVMLDDPAKGRFTTLAGFVDNGDGSYSFTGSPADAQAALRALVFDPTDGRLSAGQSDTARFTVTVSDGRLSSTDSTTAVTITSSTANTAPTLSGLSANQTVSERATLQPFANVSLADPDAGQTTTVQIALSKATMGSFTTLAGFVDGGNGVYTFTGTAAEAQAALRSLVFAPADYLAAPGSSSSLKLTISYTDGVAATKSTSAYVAIQAENTTPTLSGTITSTVVDTKTVKPFAMMTITDPDRSATETVTVKIDDPAKGVFSTLAGFVDQGNGIYTYTGSLSSAQTALRSLVFNPTDGRVAAGASDTAGFTVTVSDGTASSTNTATTVTITASTPANATPTLSGLVSGQTVSELSTIQPFANVTYSDADTGQMETVQVTVAQKYGSLGNLGGFVDGGNGVYSFSGTAAEAQAALRGLVFTPADHLAAPGSTTSASLKVSYTDGVAAARSTTISVAIQAEDTAPILSGATTSSVTDIKTVKPFAMMTIADPDKGAAETVTVKLDDPAKGTFSSLAGFTSQGEGVYTYTGSPSSAQSALRSLVFDPTDGRIAQGQTELAQFTVSVSDGMAAVFDEKTKVLVSGTAQPGQTLYASSMAA
jgi:VCBS repeat-containing protein